MLCGGRGIGVLWGGGEGWYLLNRAREAGGTVRG
jgi:hypothetical protein